MGLAVLLIVACILGTIYGIWYLLLLFPIVSMWIGIAIAVSLAYMIGTSLDESIEI
jgi:hypothetical protein